MFGNTIASSRGREVEIVDPGVHNLDAGPDFSAAVIRTEGMEWAGNVEIHVRASDWTRHGHNTDRSYDSVILHVVGVEDTQVKRTDGSEILQVCVSPPAEFYNRYATLTERMDLPTCLPWLDTIPGLNRADWLSSLGIERLQQKAQYMKDVLDSCSGDWQQTIFIMLARSFGFGLNGVAFEMLAKSLPLNFVMRHRDFPVQVEALVFGQAGMLNPEQYKYDDYYMELCREYEFLKKKYNLRPLGMEIWKYSRTRPQNFPHRRLAILSTMIAGGMQIHTAILEARGNYDSLMEILEARASAYWHTHSRFGEAESTLPISTELSRPSKEIVLINVMAPFYMAYGSLTGDPETAEKGLDLLRELKAEKNSIVALWERHGLKPESAFDSQALLHLRKNYCDRSRCLECRFGHFLLRRSIK